MREGGRARRSRGPVPSGIDPIQCSSAQERILGSRHESCVYLEKRKNRPNPTFCWRIRLDVAMTDKDTIKHIHDTLLVGWWGPRTVRPGRKPQWRWSTSFRGANEVAKLFLPYAITKKEVLQKIVDHYGSK